MNRLKIKILGMALALCAWAPAARAQAVPTASQVLEVSAFGGATGTYTGLQKGKNLGITAGIDVGMRRFVFFNPSIEVRGTYPFHKGSVDSLENVLFGVKLEKRYFRFHPYVDVLFGRGQIDYQSGGALSADGQYYYLQTPSNVFSPGVGVDIVLNHSFSAKLDAQLQRYTTPVTSSGAIYAKPLTVGLVYHVDFSRFGRHK